jgi:ribosome biogenesis GTPase
MLIAYGWSHERQQTFDEHYPGLAPARVVEQQRNAYRVVAADGEHAAHVSGRLAFAAAPGELPAVGDWVALAATTIHHVLPRASAFQRKAPDGRVQTICANLDIALLVNALNGDFNPRRLERYLAVARQGGAAPVIVLTKADLCDARDARRAAAEAIAGDAPVLTVSALSGDGLDRLAQHLPPGRTAALMGSSGAGKSTLLNAMAGAEFMDTRAISGDGKRGRHTTTHRQLFLLPSGALMLDSPGLRELSVATAEDGVSATFEDIEAIVASCRFNNCRHGGEPGCAVSTALQEGALDAGRWAGYLKLQRELAFEARKESPAERAAHRETWLKRAKAYRAQKKFRERLEED